MPHKNIMQIFAISTVLAVIVRFTQHFFLIEAETGFSVKGGFEKINIILYVVLIVLAAIPSFFTAVSSNRQPTRAPIPKSFKLLTVSNFVMAVLMLALAGISALKLTDGGVGVSTLLEIILMLLSALWFILYATAGLADYKLPTVLSLAPVGLYTHRLITVFISHNGLANISENLIITLFLCAMLIFFLMQSKILCKVAIRKTSRHIFTVAIIAFYLMALCNIPPAVMVLIGKSELLHTSASFNFEYVLIGCYALIFTMQLYSKSKWPTSIHNHSTERMENAQSSTPNTKFIIDINTDN